MSPLQPLPLQLRYRTALLRLQAILLVLGICATAFARAAAPRAGLQPNLLPDSEAMDIALRYLLLHAPIVFSGQVLPSPQPAVPPDPSNSRLIRIRVDHALRGVHDGDIFPYQSWRSSNRSSLRPGDRIVLFLHQPNVAGYTSPASASLAPLLITGNQQIDVRQLLLLQRLLAPSAGSRSKRVDSTAVCPPSSLQAGGSGDYSALTADQLTCRRSPTRVAPLPADGSMPEPQFLALVRSLIAAIPVPEEASHAP